MSKYKLTDVIDLNYLQLLQDSFSDATGMAATTVDFEGNVTNPSNYTDFCMKYTRRSDKGAERCSQCDIASSKEFGATGKPTIYTCHAGLTCISVPILLNGDLIGNIIGGQVLSKAPDESKFIKIAEDLGINPDSYLSAVRKLPILTETKIKGASKLLGYIVEKLTENHTAALMLHSSYTDIIQHTEDIKSTLDSFYQTSDELNGSQQDLINEIQNINVLLKEINSIVKSVSSLADETQMISFNASIEAARAGEQGKSFTVIAGEIRRLSEQSKKTVSNIQNFTANIQNSIVKTSDHSQDCMNSISSELQELNQIKTNIESIQKVLSKLEV